jgi:hypothetical protein
VASGCKRWPCRSSRLVLRHARPKSISGRESPCLAAPRSPFCHDDPAPTLILIRERVEAALDDARHSNVSKRDQGQLDIVKISEHVGPMQIG